MFAHHDCLDNFSSLEQGGLKGSLHLTPVYTCKEARSLNALKSGSERSVPLENGLKHLAARLVEVFWPVNVDSADVFKGLLHRGSL